MTQRIIGVVAHRPDRWEANRTGENTMLIYPYRTTDVSPDTLRSSRSGEEFFLSRRPCTTNMSHEQRCSGWCGATDDSSLDALGVVDTDDEDWLEELRALLPDEVDVNELDVRTWLAREQDSDGGDDDMRLPYDESTGSRSATWNPADDNEDWFPELRPGWVLFAGEDDSESYLGDRGGCPIDEGRRALQRLFGGYTCDTASAILDAVGIDYDEISCVNQDSGGTSSWRYYNVHDADKVFASACVDRACELAVIGAAEFTAESLLVAIAKWARRHVRNSPRT